MTDKQIEKQKSGNANAHEDSIVIASNAKNIDSHKQAAAHHIEAAKHHLEAAKNHENGDHEKAAHNTVLAYGHAAIAGDFLSDDAKHHAQELKQIKYS
jgi:hypothetical protein